MGWQDRRYDDEPGNWRGEPRWKRGARRVFVEGDNFYSWGIPLFRAWGIEVRLHLLFLVYVVIELLRAVAPDGIGLGQKLAMMGTLFGIVLIHEFGHCFACRWVGGSADRIMLWPLGGLATVRPPHNWKASLVTTLGGPAVHLVIGPILAGVMLAMGAPMGVLLFNPFSPGFVLGDTWFAGELYWLKRVIWAAHYMNAALFLFNMLLVMFPMDAGRVVQELLWSRMGYKRSMLIASTLGMVMAVIVGVFALTTDTNVLLGIAVFAGITCFQERRRVAMLDEFSGMGEDPWQGFGRGRSGRRPAAVGGISGEKMVEVARADIAQEQQEVDRILDKVAKEGLQSLTGKEKKLLKRATDRQRERDRRAEARRR